MSKPVKIIATLGPATKTEAAVRLLKDRGVDLVRVNMSHSNLTDLRYFIDLAKKVGIPFVLDTEGSQIRTGALTEKMIYVEEGAEIALYADAIIGDSTKLTLTPHTVVSELEAGDILRVDFDTLILRVNDTSTVKQGFIKATAVSAGYVGNNKGVVVDTGTPRNFTLPGLTAKDREAIAIGLAEGVGYIAASFMRSAAYVDEVREVTKGTMKIISKIECVDGLENLDEIIEATDFLLIDRGDLSKEIPLEKIPLTQKIILHRARQKNKGVFVATNLLETMVEKKKPTRAEIHDVVNTIMDGAYGLALSAETAIGKYPVECATMLNRLILHIDKTVAVKDFVSEEDKLVAKMESDNYLLNIESASTLIEPHGGKLVDRMLKKKPETAWLKTLPKIALDDNAEMDVEQIAIGTFSPLTGFMGEKEVQSVLDTMRLPNGLIWPLPIVLDVNEETAKKLEVGKQAVLQSVQGTALALITVSELYSIDKKEFAEKLYGTLDETHPGVARVMKMNPVLVAGAIDLFERRPSETRAYELTPRQVRRLFDERGWTKVVGFHTRNVIHRSHEFIQLKAMEQELCDGLFVHPVIGKKKPRDFNAPYIIKSYEMMMKDFYPRNKVVFATYATFSRYAGPREALFTALCRQNFGCSHFIVGRDHTGVGKFYAPTASHDIFDQFPDLKIKPVRFEQVFYSAKKNDHVHEAEDTEHAQDEKLHISGTEARKMLEKGQLPPNWFMRPEISEMILKALANGEEVFVKE